MAKDVPESISSISDLANFMAAKRAEASDNSQEEVTDVGTDEVPDEGAVEAPVEAASAQEDFAQEEDATDEDVSEEEDDTSEEEVNAADEPVLEIDDDTLFDLEGHDGPVSFKDLVEVWSADETIRAKVAETSAMHEEISRQRTTAITDSEKLSDAMAAVVTALDGVLSQPLVSAPDAALKSADPSRYLQHLDAYQEDQERIKNTRDAVLNALQKHNETREEVNEQRKVHEIARLTEALPQLKTPEGKTAVFTDISDSATYYKFTKEELNSATADHRLFKMAYDAAQYRKLLAKQEGKAETTSALKKTIKAKTSVIRTKGNTQPRTSVAKVKRAKAAKQVAQKTGKPADVVAYMQAARQVNTK